MDVQIPRREARFHKEPGEHEFGGELGGIKEAIGGPPGGKTRILVVDDDRTVRLSVVEAIKVYLGEERYHVEDAENGASALRKFRERKFEIVITDFNLEDDINGPGVIAGARELYPEIKTVIMSDHPKRAKEAKADRFLKKPFRDEALIRTIKGLEGEMGKQTT